MGLTAAEREATARALAEERDVAARTGAEPPEELERLIAELRCGSVRDVAGSLRVWLMDALDVVYDELRTAGIAMSGWAIDATRGLLCLIESIDRQEPLHL